MEWHHSETLKSVSYPPCSDYYVNHNCGALNVTQEFFKTFDKKFLILGKPILLESFR